MERIAKAGEFKNARRLRKSCPMSGRRAVNNPGGDTRGLDNVLSAAVND
jgi:hypothetical protein